MAGDVDQRTGGAVQRAIALAGEKFKCGSIDLACPGGGELRWNAELGTMESTLLGCPAGPKTGANLPPGLEGFRTLSFGLTFEHQGLRARGSLTR